MVKGILLDEARALHWKPVSKIVCTLAKIIQNSFDKYKAFARNTLNKIENTEEGQQRQWLPSLKK